MSGFEREDEEIIRYYDKVKAHDLFGIWGTELLMRLPLNKATRFMKPDHGWDEESWSKSMLKKDRESIVNEMEDYFQFAWEKAITHRGLSASRSIQHYLAWAWLSNDMELFAYAMEPSNYPNYGAPVLLAVAQKYEFLDLLPENKYDREVFLRMAKGQFCSTLCKGGCGVGSPAQMRPFDQSLHGSKKGLITPKII